MVTGGWKKSRRERIKQKWKWLAAKVPCRIHNSVLHFPRPRSNSKVKNFLLRIKQNKTKQKYTPEIGSREVEHCRKSSRWPPADHKEPALKLAQVNPHLGAITCLPHPDLQGRRKGNRMREGNTEESIFQKINIFAWISVCRKLATSSRQLVRPSQAPPRPSALLKAGSGHQSLNSFLPASSPLYLWLKNWKAQWYWFHFGFDLKDIFWFGLIIALSTFEIHIFVNINFQSNLEIFSLPQGTSIL